MSSRVLRVRMLSQGYISGVLAMADDSPLAKYDHDSRTSHDFATDILRLPSATLWLGRQFVVFSSRGVGR